MRRGFELTEQAVEDGDQTGAVGLVGRDPLQSSDQGLLAGIGAQALVQQLDGLVGPAEARGQQRGLRDAEARAELRAERAA